MESDLLLSCFFSFVLNCQRKQRFCKREAVREKKKKKHNKSFPVWALIVLGPYRDLTISHNI